MATYTTKAAAWLKLHGASERSFARALRRFFLEQAERIAGQIEADGPTPLLIHLASEYEAMLPIVSRNLIKLMAAGANDVLSQVSGRKSMDPVDPEYMERFDLSAGDIARLFQESLPEPVRQAIIRAVDEVTKQDYWQKIQVNVAADLDGIIKTSIAEGESNQKMAIRIREVLGDGARKRAMTIARTEATGSLNSGHQAAMEAIADSDLVMGKEWLAIGDKSTRHTHMSAHGQIVPVKDNFTVGGYPARYPGDCLLPAAERISCRCTVVAAIIA